MPDAGQPNQIQGQASLHKQKKPQELPHSLSKKPTVEDANKRVAEFFQKLQAHEHAHLMD
jgi:hypothetical protein